MSKVINYANNPYSPIAANDVDCFGFGCPAYPYTSPDRSVCPPESDLQHAVESRHRLEPAVDSFTG